MNGLLRPTSAPAIFDRNLLKIRRDRIAGAYPEYGFLKDATVKNLATRLKLIKRPFNNIIELGCHTGQLSRTLPDLNIISTDISENMVRQASCPLKIVLDEEFLPFAKNSVDLIISALSLHWVNDVPDVMAQIFRCLKPDGLFISAFYGGGTLRELRDCLMTAELEISGGAAPRFSPLISVKTAGDLLQRAGFALPVVDHQPHTVTYPHLYALLKDLHHMGETNALFHRVPFLPRSVLKRAGELYTSCHGLANGRIPATFDVITMTGWVPHPSQQIALKPGSATIALETCL